MTDAGAGLDTLQPSRRSLLFDVKRRGEVSVEDLAEGSGLTISAVRQHLTALAAEDLVERRSEAGGPGRPRHLYRLTKRGHGLFPSAYGELATELLGYFADADPALVDGAFERRRRRRLESARARLAGLDLAGKVAEMARILDEDGYLADWEVVEPGVWRITEHNCAIFGVARRYGQACSSEIAFLRQALTGAKVERVAHMVAGQHMCSYLVTAR
ncbi:MAG TPA: hypothetical protein VFH45_03935 [Acidimicrobiales bacterium]|nr:hypothetical protein [Acidimicrobiales bacterium]